MPGSGVKCTDDKSKEHYVEIAMLRNCNSNSDNKTFYNLNKVAVVKDKDQLS